MHKKSYNINVVCFCNKNFTSALEEIKSFFGFNLITKSINIEDLRNNKFDAIIVDYTNNKKIFSNNIKTPKILIHENSQTNTFQDKLSLVIKLPIDVVQFNQDVINVCKKIEFNKNSLIKIKDYILDKNERVLKKNDESLKITEKEINFIEILFNSKKPLSRNYILKNIWNYSSDTDTHTIETHIYRLRQKIKNQFKDVNFIKNSKEGYSL